VPAHVVRPAGQDRVQVAVLEVQRDEDRGVGAAVDVEADRLLGIEQDGAERGCPTRFQLVLRLPDGLTDEQVERLRIIAAKCPVHRTLDGEVMFDERVERVTLAS